MSTDDLFAGFPAPASPRPTEASHPMSDPFESHDEDEGFGVAAFSISGREEDVFGDSTTKPTNLSLDAPSGLEENELFSPSIGPTEASDEETPLSIWQSKRKLEIKEKMEKEHNDKIEAVEQANAEMKIFFENRNQTTEKNKAANRTAEAEFRNDLESVMKNGTLWEQVAKLVDLKPKNGKEEQTTSRMRGLLMQLKNQKDPPGTQKSLIL